MLLQSGLDEEWWADSMECYTYLRNFQDLLSDGKTPHERRFGELFNGPIIPFGSLVEYHPVSSKDQSRIHQFGKKVSPGLFLGYALYAGGICKGDMLVADIEELEEMNASEIHGKRLAAKEVLTPMRGEIFIFQIADGTVELSGGDQDLSTSTLVRDSPDRGVEQDNLRGEPDGSSSAPLQDSSWYDGEAKSDFWSISGDFIYRHHVEPRVKLYVQTEESFPTPMKYIDVTRTTDTHLDVMLEKHIEDHWNVDGERELSDAWTGFTRFTSLNERPLTVYGQKCGNMRVTHRNAKNSKRGLPRNRSSTIPEDCVVFTSLILMMRNSNVS